MENENHEKIEVIDSSEYDYLKSNSSVQAEPKAEPKQEKKKSGWERFEEMETATEYMESEYDHKAWLLGTKFRDIDVFKLHDLIQKELSLSYLPDHELALIYSIEMDCIEEILSMGMVTLAKRLMVHMLVRLKINMSIEGIESILQHGSSTVNISGERDTHEGRAVPEEEQKPKTKIGLSKIAGKLKALKG